MYDTVCLLFLSAILLYLLEQDKMALKVIIFIEEDICKEMPSVFAEIIDKEKDYALLTLEEMNLVVREIRFPEETEQIEGIYPEAVPLF